MKRRPKRRRVWGRGRAGGTRAVNQRPRRLPQLAVPRVYIGVSGPGGQCGGAGARGQRGEAGCSGPLRVREVCVVRGLRAGTWGFPERVSDPSPRASLLSAVFRSKEE